MAAGIRHRPAAAPGSQRLYDRMADKLTDQLRGKRLPAKVKQKMCLASITRNAAKSLREYNAQRQRKWTPKEAALIGIMKDTQLAELFGLRERIAVPKMGKKRPRQVIEAMRQGTLARSKAKPT
jgi:hypothetical protein